MGHLETEARTKTLWRRLVEIFEDYIKYMAPCY